MKRELLNPAAIVPPVGDYAHGLLVNAAQRTLYISGGRLAAGNRSHSDCLGAMA